MSKEQLYVYRSEKLVGTLDMPSDSDYAFTYSEEYLEQGWQPLSLAMPPQHAPIKGQVVYNYFDGLLPEGREREALAQYLRVSYLDTGALLAALGGECIGDLVLFTTDMHNAGLEAVESGYRELDTEELNAILKPQSPSLYAADISNRISLAGGQTKIGLYHEEPVKPSGNTDSELADGHWFLPFGLAASTHILKPQSREFDHLTLNEALCMKLAASCGIKAAETTLVMFDEPVLAVKRFDRVCDSQGYVTRLHQEDACQALGRASLFKYQTDGGPGFKELGKLIENWGGLAVEDLRRLIDIAIFNYLIGNCDAHGKNFAMVEAPTGSLQLAPAFDLVSTTYYGKVSREMAMSIGNQYALDKVTADDFLAFSEQIGVSAKLVIKRFAVMASGIERHLPTIAKELLTTGLEAVQPIAGHIKQEARQRAAGILG
jgi:serine/threonine-protein kinase HipA